jgi:hypothetical protein
MDLQMVLPQLRARQALCLGGTARIEAQLGKDRLDGALAGPRRVGEGLEQQVGRVRDECRHAGAGAEGGAASRECATSSSSGWRH